MAGARALVLDVARAERQLAQALELAPPDAPERASLLEDWGRAVWQQGRLREGRDAMEQALVMRRDRQEWVPAARILTRLQILHHRMGDTTGRAVEEAVELLEAQPAGPELVSAYAHLAGNRALTGRDREAIDAVDRAVTLARQLGLPEPAFAVHWRGIARLDLSDVEGIDDVERALRLAIDQGLGRETGVIYGNLMWVLGEQRGPAAALQAGKEGIAFCEARGMTELADRDRGLILYLVADLGRTEEALAEAESIADRIQASGDKDFVDIREVQLRLLAERGTPRESPELRAFVAAVHAFGEPNKTAEAIAVSLQSLLAGHRRDEAPELVADLRQLVTDDGAVLNPSTAPRAVRTLLSLGELELVERIVDSIGLRTASATLNLASSRAQVAEAAGDLPAAGRRYAAAADGWEAFGNVPEQAYARLGEGRCLAALGDTAAKVPLHRARELFIRLGYAPALAETAALLAATPMETSL
jgi:tetratricopeptide (TPR) repeat protein